MKKNKLIVFLSIVLCTSILITGCGKEIEVKNGSKVTVSTKEGKFSATEYYNLIKKDNISKLVDMIDKNILEKKYKDTDKQKEDESVNKQIEQIKSYYGESEDQYNAIIKQYFGVNSEEELDAKLRLEYKRSEAVKEYVTKNLTEDEIKNYYDENITGEIKASHILISVDTDSNASDEEKTKAEEKALKKAKNIIKKLNKGEDFAKLAKQYSTDKATASNGGDLGYFQPSEMTEAFANAVKELKTKEYTKEPVKTEYGYHIILKTGEKNKSKLKDVKNEIKEKLTTQKLNEDPTLYYNSLIKIREDSKIKWNDNSLKDAYNNYMNELIESAKTSNTTQQ